MVIWVLVRILLILLICYKLLQVGISPEAQVIT